MTNNHVIEGATAVTVHLGDRDYPAEVKGTDRATDLALLKIDAGPACAILELGDSDDLRVGDWVMVVGNPLNLDQTVTTGVVTPRAGRSASTSARSRTSSRPTRRSTAATRAVRWSTWRAAVVGIATAMNWGAENIGFAVPVTTLKEVLPQLRDKGKVSRGYLGVQIGNLDYEQQQAFGLASRGRRSGVVGRGRHAGRQRRRCSTATSSSRSTASR